METIKERFNAKMKNLIFLIYKSIVKKYSSYNLVRFAWIERLNNYIRRNLHKDYIITTDGFKVFLDKDDALHLSIHPDWNREEFMIKTVKEIVNEGDIVVDVGANIGIYSLILSKLVGEKGRVYSFEPDPDNFSLLLKNMKENNIKNVIMVNKAISDKEGKQNLYLNKDNSAFHSLIRYNNNLFEKSIEVGTTTLDNFFSNLNKKVNFIKMDIEGYEGDALKGAKELLKKSGKIKIIIEFSPEIIKNSNFGIKNLLNLLKSYNLEIRKIDEENKKLNKISDEELAKSPVDMNLLCEVK